MMIAISTHYSSSDWRLWSGGLLASLLACFSSPAGDIEYALLGAVSLLFFWGLLRSD
jgi:hypothetical protein